MRNIYEEPKLEIIKFNIEEPIMTIGGKDGIIEGTDPPGGNASEPVVTAPGFEFY